MRALVLSGGASHGAYQAGAIKALEELEWEPDIVCGTSVGAINGTAVAGNLRADRIIELWRRVENQKVYRFRPPLDWLKPWDWTYLFDTEPLREFLDKHLPLRSLTDSPVCFCCFGVDAETGTTIVFSNEPEQTRMNLPVRFDVRPVKREAVLASSSIPVVFPDVNGIWDGAVVSQVPVLPAVEMGATDIVVVTLGKSEEKSVDNLVEAALRLVDVASRSKLEADLRRASSRQKVDLTVVEPNAPLPYSRLDFSNPLMERAIWRGYEHTIREVS